MARMADLIDRFRPGWSDRITSATCGGISGRKGSRRAPLFAGRQRFPEHILKRQSFVLPPIKRSTLGNLAHKRRIVMSNFRTVITISVAWKIASDFSGNWNNSS